MSELTDMMNELWEKSKSPLERMYDSWMGEGNWEPANPRTQYAIYSRADVLWNGRMILLGQPFPCHLCNQTDHWVIEGDEVKKEIRVFVCEHEPVWVGRGCIRQVSTVPVYMVSRFEETHRFEG